VISRVFPTASYYGLCFLLPQLLFFLITIFIYSRKCSFSSSQASSFSLCSFLECLRFRSEGVQVVPLSKNSSLKVHSKGDKIYSYSETSYSDSWVRKCSEAVVEVGSAPPFPPTAKYSFLDFFYAQSDTSHSPGTHDPSTEIPL